LPVDSSGSPVNPENEQLNHDVPEPIENVHEVAAHIIRPSNNKEIEQNSVQRGNWKGFQNHTILTLSDAEFMATSIDVLMKTYGESDGGGSCSGDFGNELVNRWRDRKASVCNQNNPIQENKLNTHIDCHLVQQTRHHGGGDQLCVLSNVMVNMGLFNDDKLTTSVIETYVKTVHAQQPYIKFPQDFIQGGYIFHTTILCMLNLLVD
jgi:hypothetical protein